MHCLIAIPTFNRARLVPRAVAAALEQSHDDCHVVVIDDGSTDGTAAALAPFHASERFTFLRLRNNVGTARAKNIALALFRFDAVTFHDSDDLPDRDKLAIQARTLARADIVADEGLPWHLAGGGTEAGATATIDAVLTGHRLIAGDGSAETLCRPLSLVDDMFPNLQFGARRPGDWVLVNTGLMRRSLLARAGGYRDGLEEDREIRNRFLMHGANIWVLDLPLVTKFECPDSLTVRGDTGYASARRAADRLRLWADIEAWRRGAPPPVLPLDVEGAEIASCSRPERLAVAEDVPMAPATRQALAAQLARLCARPGTRAA